MLRVLLLVEGKVNVSVVGMFDFDFEEQQSSAIIDDETAFIIQIS